MNNIVLFLDVDGVLNQYLIHERIRRNKIHEANNFSKETDEFNPYQKKVLRLNKLIKKYNIDVYVFSAWTLENLQPHLPFKLSGDTDKYVINMNKIAKKYKHSIVIDDEISVILEYGFQDDYAKIDNNVIIYQPDYNFGLVKKDFNNLDKIFSSF